jgi:hypothetical protein
MSIARFVKDAKLKPVYQAHLAKLGSSGRGVDPAFEY